MHILLPETEMNQLKGENDLRKYFMFSKEEYCQSQQGSNLQPPDHELDAHPTAVSKTVTVWPLDSHCMAVLVS